MAVISEARGNGLAKGLSKEVLGRVVRNKSQRRRGVEGVGVGACPGWGGGDADTLEGCGPWRGYPSGVPNV